jgi:hypothetical protein
MGSGPTLGHQLLDLLVDGPSSFAALYSAANRLLRVAASPRFTVEQMWEALARMEAAGWIKARLMLPAGTWKEPDGLDRERARRQYQDWLPRAAYEEMSVDEVELWFELQPVGRSEWTKWSEAADESGKWVLDQDPETSTITVRAAHTERAEQALIEWLGRHLDIELVEDTRVVQPSAEFRLRDGTLVEGGIRLGVTYRKTRGQSGRSSS